MSKDSLTTNAYAHLESFSALAEHALLAVIDPQLNSRTDDLRHLSSLLSAMNPHEPDLDALILQSLLRNPDGSPMLDLSDLGERLAAGDINQTTIADLRIIATELGRQRNHLAHRLTSG